MPPNVVPKNTPCATIVPLTILGRPIAASTPPASKEVTPNQSQIASLPLPPLPTAPIAAMTTMSSSGNAGLDQFPLLNPRPPQLPQVLTLFTPPTVKRRWIWRTMAV